MIKSKFKGRRPSKMSGVKGLFLLIFLAGGIILLYLGYNRYLRPNVRIRQEDGRQYLYIHTGSTFEQVESLLEQSHSLVNARSFEWMAVKMNYPRHVKPGKYLIRNGMSNRALIRMLRSGEQVPVRLVFHNIRFKRELAADISKQIEADSLSMLRLLNNNNVLSRYGLNSTTVMSVFIPNTYDVYWNISAMQFLNRMVREYKKFWNKKRLQECRSIGLSPLQVSILASIVEEETQKNDEKKLIAGVYMNRLHKGMLLQADPTVRYAYGDFSIKRILNKYKKIDSKYNTYKYSGLPPGPICIPSISSIDAVLNYQKTDYLYFCAKADFSGYHAFARTLEQHLRNAQRYQRALDNSGIMH